MTQDQLPTRITPQTKSLAEIISFRKPNITLEENEEFQREYLLHLIEELKPQGILEQAWVEDVFDHVWNLMRYRRLKTALLNAAAYQGLQLTLTPLIGATDALALATQWHAKDADAINEVADILRSAGLSAETFMAQTLAIKLLEIEAIDRLIVQEEAQRNVALRELDRHRALLGQRVRQAIERVEDVDYTPVDGTGGGEATQ